MTDAAVASTDKSKYSSNVVSSTVQKSATAASDSGMEVDDSSGADDVSSIHHHSLAITNSVRFALKGGRRIATSSGVVRG